MCKVVVVFFLILWSFSLPSPLSITRFYFFWSKLSGYHLIAPKTQKVEGQIPKDNNSVNDNDEKMQTSSVSEGVF